MFNFLSIVLTGILIIALGLHANRNPYSWWFRRMSDDTEPSDVRIWYIKFIGKVIIVFGVVVTLMSFQHL
ncbi:hypothetical protein AMS62_07945 [Bacillus sp. FJAT-18019]|nr:hypothetical protein AMS62_07945 [Bacillus sp. FJAT-18019]